jgi:aerobic-type carbon monoxide dehydrogenase small subunit (CoxS/CutS family)
MDYRLQVNGTSYDISAAPFETLVTVLRDHCQLTGTKVGCRVGYCGACTVLLDGLPVHACCVVAADCVDSVVTTIEQAATEPLGERVIAEFERQGAVQCGYCTPGFVMTAAGMPAAAACSRQAVRDYLVGNICRCTGFVKPVDAICTARGVTR